MSAERIDYLTAGSGTGGRRDYVQAWIASINPTCAARVKYCFAM